MSSALRGGGRRATDGTAVDLSSRQPTAMARWPQERSCRQEHEVSAQSSGSPRKEFRAVSKQRA